MKPECIDVKPSCMAAAAVETGVQTHLESPAGSTGAVPAPGIWETVRRAYQRISGLPELAPGEAHGYEAILQTWIDTFAASHQFHGD